MNYEEEEEEEDYQPDDREPEEEETQPDYENEEEEEYGGDAEEEYEEQDNYGEEEEEEESESEYGDEDMDTLYRNYEILSEFYQKHYVDLRVLDETCEPTKYPAPSISNGIVRKYERVENVLLPGEDCYLSS